jgi:hypothetical protein
MEASVWRNKFKDGQRALNDNPEKHRGRPWTWYTDENCVIVEGLIREYLRFEVFKITELQYFTSLGKEQYHKVMFKLVKRWDKCLESNSDCVEK